MTTNLCVTLSAMVNVLVMEASRHIDKVNACRYALLNYLEVYNLKPPAHTAIYVYTDQPAFFESFIPFFHRFEIKEVSQAQLKEWCGPHGFTQRIKMEILSEVAAHVEGNVLYMDADCYITAPLETVFSGIEQGNFLMHSVIGLMNDTTDPALLALRRFLLTDSIKQNGDPLVANGLKIWNACATGINSHSKTVLDDVLELTDVSYKQFPQPVIEHFAFSYCFQKAGDIKSCDSIIHHYKGLREFGQLLQVFFKKNEEESIPNLIKLVHQLDPALIQKHKNHYEALPLYKRWLRIITWKQWNIKQYEKKI